MSDGNVPAEQRVFGMGKGLRPQLVNFVRCENIIIEGVSLLNSPFWVIHPMFCKNLTVRNAYIYNEGPNGDGCDPESCEDVLIENCTFHTGDDCIALKSGRNGDGLRANIPCKNVIIRGCTVRSTGGRTDGIDIESSSHVLIEYCTLSCGDDCFTLKAGRAEDGLRVNRPTSHVVIRHCLAEEGPGGVTIGSETAGFIRNVYMHDCVFTSPSNGFYFKSRRNRGGGGQHLTFRRIRMLNPGRAFYFDMLGSPFYVGELANRLPARPITPLIPAFSDISMDQFRRESCKELMLLKGLPESPIQDLTISHLEATTTQRDLKVQDVCGLIMTDCLIK